MTTEKMSVEQALGWLDGIVAVWGYGHHREAINTLRAELDGMKADAERLDWLLARIGVDDRGPFFARKSMLDAKASRAAIDTALTTLEQQP